MTRLPPASPRFIAFALLCVVAGLSAPTASRSAPANPLLGSWKFSGTNKDIGAAGCSQAFVFAEKTATITYANNETMHGAVKTMAVTYVPSPTLVFVMTDAAGHVNYNIADASHMYIDDPWGRCNYVRTK